MPRMLQLFENVGHVTQFCGGDNTELRKFLLAHENRKRIEIKDSSDIFAEIYLGDVTGDQDAILLKDFHFNLCKTLHPVVDKILST